MIRAISCGDINRLKEIIKEAGKEAGIKILDEDINTSEWVNEYKVCSWSSWRTRIKELEIEVETSFDGTLWWVYVNKI